MKITRKVPKKRGRPPRPAKRYIDQKKQVSYISGINDTLNNPQSFTYMDYNRNQNSLIISYVPGSLLEALYLYLLSLYHL